MTSIRMARTVAARPQQSEALSPELAPGETVERSNTRQKRREIIGGHSSIQVTVDIYGHLIPGTNVGFVDKLDSMMTPRESAGQPQERKLRESNGFKQVLGNEWLGGRDSNPDTQIQSLQSYR